MVREIGSEFWINNGDSVKKSNKMPSWLTKFGNVVLTTSGRGALSLLLEKIKPRVKSVLLPSYICGSVILPFKQAGYDLIFYDVDKYLRPVNYGVINSSNVGIFFHMGYFGFTTNNVLSDTIISLKSESVIIIEDVTHTLFTEHSGSIESDFFIGSIRKWFGIPSGGFLATDRTMNYELSDTNVEFVNIRKSSLHQKFEYMSSGNRFIKSTYLSGFNRAEDRLDEDIKPYKIDYVSELIIKNLDYKELESSRRTNYEFLRRHLGDVDEIEIIFNGIENNVTPIFFPIYIKNGRDELRRKLIEEEIYCPVHWPIPNQVNNSLNVAVENIYNSILSIPCDQRYQIEDMRRIAYEIANFFKNRTC